MKVDLSFVPAAHQVAAAVPAVSGSSGKLVMSVPKGDQAERGLAWTGIRAA